jgi:hypothetical protein
MDKIMVEIAKEIKNTVEKAEDGGGDIIVHVPRRIPFPGHRWCRWATFMNVEAVPGWYDQLISYAPPVKLQSVAFVEAQLDNARCRAKLVMLLHKRNNGRNIGVLPEDICKLVISHINSQESSL